MPELRIALLGRRPYAEVLEIQRAAAVARLSGALEEDLLLLVEHPPVITLGRGARDPSHLKVSHAELAARGMELFEVDRGGDITYHGPGQLVGYPIIDLRRHRRDLHWYLRRLEDVLIRALSRMGIAADRREGLTGVWTSGRKIASIGVHARQWVTWHGFALNVTTDLSAFDVMVPCGIPDVTMTSVQRELRGSAPDRAALDAAAIQAVVAAAAEVFKLTPVHIEPDTLNLTLPVGGSA